jgi:hypothetical protein
MYIFPVYFTEKLKIDFLQRVILIHSFLYYEKDENIISDKKYDEIARQLVVIQELKTKNWVKQNTQYGYAFYDFDGSTGFDLWERLKRKDRKFISSIAMGVLKDAKKDNKVLP